MKEIELAEPPAGQIKFDMMSGLSVTDFFFYSSWLSSILELRDNLKETLQEQKGRRTSADLLIAL